MATDLEYNSKREPLKIPEYGRHMQKMVNRCKTIVDKDKREKFAKGIITTMGNLQPHLRDVPDFRHKLWDQLFIMADFDLDVTTPFEKPTAINVQYNPERIAYPQKSNKYKFYGLNIQAMIEKAMMMEASEKQTTLFFTIANHMKKCYLNWNKDSVEDRLIFKHLKEMSGGKIDLTTNTEPLQEGKVLLKSKVNFSRKTNQKQNGQQKKQQKKER